MIIDTKWIKRWNQITLIWLIDDRCKCKERVWLTVCLLVRLLMLHRHYTCKRIVISLRTKWSISWNWIFMCLIKRESYLHPLVSLALA